MNPLDKLKGILSQQPPSSYIGTVIAIDGEGVSVQTSRGRERVLKNPALIISIGDEVLVSNGAVQGRVKRAGDVPVYRV